MYIGQATVDGLDYKKGDCVVLVSDHPDGNEDLVCGCTGTIMYMTAVDDDDPDPWAGVWWDEQIYRGHTLNDNSVPEGHGWHVPIRVLRPLMCREINDEDIPCDADLMSFIGL